MTLGQRVRGQLERALQAHGIALRHLSALGHLAREPGISYSELARRAHITPQSMQATLRALEERGAVERATDPGRGRTAALHVTTEGHRLRRLGQDVIAGLDDDLLGLLPPDLQSSFVRALVTVALHHQVAPARTQPAAPLNRDTGEELSTEGETAAETSGGDEG